MTHPTFAAYWCGSIGSIETTEASAAASFFATFPKHSECLVRPVAAVYNGVPQFEPGRGTYVQRPVEAPRSNLRRIK